MPILNECLKIFKCCAFLHFLMENILYFQLFSIVLHFLFLYKMDSDAHFTYLWLYISYKYMK